MYDDIKFVYLKSHPLFHGVPEQTIKDACSLVKVKTVYRGETFGFGEGSFSKLFLLIKGKIKITELDDTDNELIKDLLTAPDLFGDLSLEGKPSQDEQAEALTSNTIICSFTVPDFKKLMQESAVIAFNFVNTVNRKLKSLEGRHSDLVFRDAKSRLIRFIKNWARTDGSRVGDKIILNNYLTHSDIAGVIATSRQSVNVLFNELRESGLLYYNRKKIELNDPLSWN